MTNLLEGIRVLDFTTVVSGPVCTQALAALGAEVTKVEPIAGDTLRKTREPQVGNLSGLFVQINQGKKSIALDLRDPAANAACMKLASMADVVVENFRPGVMDRLGLGYDAVRVHNAGVIYASISGFGPSGPWAEMRAYDSMIQALGGFMYKQGGTGSPQQIQCAVADKITGHATAQAVLAALFARERGKGGRHVSVAMLDAYINFMFQDMMASETFLDHSARGAGFNPHISFQTADGWIAFLFLGLEEYHAFFGVCGRPDLAVDARFATRASLQQHFGAWQQEIAPDIRLLTTDDLIDRCRALKLPVAPVLDQQGMLALDQVAHNGIFSQVDLGGAFGRARLLNAPWRFAGEAGQDPMLPPDLGEHTVETLHGAGLSADEVSDLLDRGAAAAPDLCQP